MFFSPSVLCLPTKPSGPTSFRAILSARMEELPWAMLANGPAWTNTGFPCRFRWFTCNTKLTNEDRAALKPLTRTFKQVLHWTPCCKLLSPTSSVCIRFGLMASFISTIKAPLTPCSESQCILSALLCLRNLRCRYQGDPELQTRSSVVMGCPPRLEATTILARRCRMSSRLLVRARTAIISLATVMSNWAWMTESSGQINKAEL